MAKEICIIIALNLLIILPSCEEVIEVDLNYANPEFVVEAKLFKDSVARVRITRTTSYFLSEGSLYINDANIKVSNGKSSEELFLTGDGYYSGNKVIGTENGLYELEILHNNKIYKAASSMPLKTDIFSVNSFKFESQSIFNPYGETVFTIYCDFFDNPEVDNYYMIRYVANGRLIENRFFLLTEKSANGGSFSNSNNKISFSESIFYDGGEVELQLYSIDKSAYNYFKQLDDVLFWKRRVMPPTPYNPESNFSNGALGYFAAWTFDSEKLILR